MEKAGQQMSTPGEGGQQTWQDLVVVPRRALKTGRLELMPTVGASINDVLIRHYGVGGNLTYFLSEVFSVGVQGMLYIKERSHREGLIGQQFNLKSSLNKNLYGAALNFGYIPVHGKFSFFNSGIVSWDLSLSAGIGWIQTEILPRSNKPGSSIHAQRHRPELWCRQPILPGRLVVLQRRGSRSPPVRSNGASGPQAQ